MNVKITDEKIIHGRDAFFKEEVRVLDDDVGEYFCKMGWAEDVDGSVSTGERSTTHVSVVPESVAEKLNSTGA